jgi:tryptophan synthase alpha chain
MSASTGAGPAREGAPGAGANRLDVTFARLKAAGEIGLFPYLTAGFPDAETSARLLDAIAEGGADGLELGIPFSDPLADGVTLQRASARALAGGMTLRKALGLVRDFRTRHDIPINLMSYVNPLLAYGIPRLVADAAEAGVDAFIVPDLSIEEAAELQAACEGAGLHYVYLVAPTSPDERLARVGGRARGFVYCVTLVGTTGARASVSDELPQFLARLRGHISAPLVAGFGISRPEHVRALVGQVDGAIVGARVADVIEEDEANAVERVRAFVREMKAATRPGAPAGAAAGAR